MRVSPLLAGGLALTAALSGCGGGALRVLFGEAVGSGLTMYQWALNGQGRPAEVPKASALVGDVTTYEFGVGTRLGELRAGTEGVELEVLPGDEMLEPSFRLRDQSAGFFGGLTGPLTRRP